MSRHGESVNNTLNIIGGNSHLSNKGKKYSDFLSEYFIHEELTVWISDLTRTKETVSTLASTLSSTPTIWKNLNEINAGDFDGLILDNIKAYYPKLYQTRNNDKLNKSYPNGESYIDLQKRVVKVLKNINMEKNDILLIVAHQAVCRVIYSYFTKEPLSDCTNIDIDLHTIYELIGKKFIKSQGMQLQPKE